MNVQIQSVKFDADQKLVEFVGNKMSKLEKFSEKIVSSDVIMKVDKDHEKGNKVATITLYMPGEDLVAKARARSFEEAVDEAVEELRGQIIKQKEKLAM
ncbi:MAG: ribosome-associated translation inhibitor RaiA [Alistipes sp.]|jgi:putative sigma-54 modulation protein|nr:ribosome-associated translation inhibitor RaiA [Alistipes sp.]